MRLKRIAFLVFPRVTLLDFVGGYDALRRVRSMGIDNQLMVRIIGTQEDVVDDSGFPIRVHSVLEDLTPYDLLYIPGGFGIDALEKDERVLEYVRGWDDYKALATVCTGALLAGAAGHLTNMKATTHPTAYERLAPYCREVVRDQRVVDEGRVVTAGGVTCSIDLGLHLVARHFGEEAYQTISTQMDYPIPV